MATRSVQQPLFGVVPALPDGMRYEREVLSREEEASLLERIRALPLQEAKYRQYTARRRMLSYGGQYDFGARKLDPGAPVPEILFPLREKVARWAGVAPGEFRHALVTEYRPGTPLGWHRDVPDFEVVVGVSLAGRARMRLRPYRPGKRHDRKDAISLELEPRSAYVLRDAARWGWQHCIAATKELRYSITFRTFRGESGRRGPAEG
jgi:alkylated DNA repair dioxygenase AlkB